MTKLQQMLLYSGVAVLAVTAGFLLRGQLMSSNLAGWSTGARRQIEEPRQYSRPACPTCKTTNQPISQWRGKVMVVNFWASWCEPCRKEIPEFIEFQEKFRD